MSRASMSGTLGPSVSHYGPLSIVILPGDAISILKFAGVKRRKSIIHVPNVVVVL